MMQLDVAAKAGAVGIEQPPPAQTRTVGYIQS